MKKFADTKIMRTFAPDLTLKTSINVLSEAAFFVPANIHIGFRFSSGRCFTARLTSSNYQRERKSFFIYKHFNPTMKTSIKNVKRGSNSTPNPRRAGRKSVSYKKKFLVEKSAKNKSYYFILSHGLYGLFADFCSNVSVKDAHSECAAILLGKLME